MAQGVCVITEFRGGAFRRVSFEVASEGRRLADALGEPLTAIALGDGVAAAAADFGPVWGGEGLRGRPAAVERLSGRDLCAGGGRDPANGAAQGGAQCRPRWTARI